LAFGLLALVFRKAWLGGEDLRHSDLTLEELFCGLLPKLIPTNNPNPLHHASQFSTSRAASQPNSSTVLPNLKSPN
jgi:hypothetical protein